MSSYWECHDDAIADAIHDERYGDVGELRYDCPYCFGEEAFQHIGGDSVKCSGCDRHGEVVNGAVEVYEDEKELTTEDYAQAIRMIPQWPPNRPLPEPYLHLLADCLAKSRKATA